MPDSRLPKVAAPESVGQSCQLVPVGLFASAMSDLDKLWLIRYTFDEPQGSITAHLAC